MKILNFEEGQGSQEWFAAKAGVLTASRVGPLVTAGGKASKAKGAETLVLELAAERMTGVIENAEQALGGFAARGTELESEAFGAMRWHLPEPPVRVGFCLADSGEFAGRIGCSPDGLVGDAGGLELKCPKRSNHVRYLLDGDGFYKTYRTQVQHSLLVTGREWWTLASYCPGFPQQVIECYPEPEYQAVLAEGLRWVIERTDEVVAKVAAMDPTHGMDEDERAAFLIFGP